MSDTTNNAISPAEPAAPAPAPATPQEPERDYRSLYEQEKEGRQSERNLYRPAQRLLSDLDPDSQEAMLALAEMVRRGDAQGITDWALTTAEHTAKLSGSDLAAAIAARQAAQHPQAPAFGQQPGPLPTPPQPQLDVEVVREIARAEAAAETKLRADMQVIASEIGTAGYSPYDPAGQTIIRYARQNGSSVADAIKWYQSSIQAQALAAAQAAGAAAAQTPGTAPSGAPAGSNPNEGMSPRDRAMARLSGQRQA